LEQARKFTETSAVTGIVLTKLDAAPRKAAWWWRFRAQRELNLPIRYVGAGEQPR
jgi:signal recognition particle GTPase